MLSQVPQHPMAGRICSVTGCADPVRARGLCALHYDRDLRGRALDGRKIIRRDGPCLVDGCDRPRRSRGLCSQHYDGARRQRSTCAACGGSCAERSVLCAPCYRSASSAPAPVDKFCRACGETKPIDAFGLRAARSGSAKWRSTCRSCESAQQQMRAVGRVRDRTSDRLSSPFQGLRGYAKRLGIPWEQIVARYPADNRCEVCGRTPSEAQPGGRFARLHLDHDHETGALRGFLCGPCNTGIGHLGDTRDGVAAALAYFDRLPNPKDPR